MEVLTVENVLAGNVPIDINVNIKKGRKPMPVIDQVINDRYALYNSDCMEVLMSLPSESIDVSIYSPPFPELYQYSDDPRDISNCVSYDETIDHYEHVVKEVVRLTKPGRLSCVHCTDLKRGVLYQHDFPGHIIRLYEKHGMHYFCRTVVWKDPWEFARRTRMKTLMHMTIVKDSATSRIAPADHLCVFLKPGQNSEPITHERGFRTYPGSRLIPRELREYLNFKGDQRENRLSHWIYRQLASPVWMDIRRGRMLPYDAPKEGAEAEERHVCILQQDFIERCLMLWSNPGDIVLDPFAGVGSTPFCAVKLGRRAIGCELKPTYYRQACENMKSVDSETDEGFKFDITDDHEEDEDGPLQTMMFGDDAPEWLAAGAAKKSSWVDPEDEPIGSDLDLEIAKFAVDQAKHEPLPEQAELFGDCKPKKRRKAKS